jgi:dienelactone hydrolase
MIRVARFVRSYMRHPASSVREEEVTLSTGAEERPATLVRPPGAGPLPGWIVLHGVTVPGRRHPVLTRFAHALAGSGAVVLLPEVPEWRRLRLDAEAGDRAVAESAEYLLGRPDVTGGLNLVGFSFGATQALMSAAKDGVRDSVRGVVGFGGYCDLGRSIRCMMTGEHEWAGVRHLFDPDPYGRWVVVGNFLTAIPEFSSMVELRQAALDLAAESGRRGVYAAEQSYDPFKAELREKLPPVQREIWDLIAPPVGVRPPREMVSELADRFAAAAYRVSPGLDPRPLLGKLDQRIVLAHGHEDRLIPFTESLRLMSELPPTADASVAITRLFAHSRGAGSLGVLHYPVEVGRYVALLRRALRPC